METKNIIIGVGVLAVGGFLAWKFLKKPAEPNNEQPTNEPMSGVPPNYTAQQSTEIAKSLSKPTTPQSNAGSKPPTDTKSKAQVGGKPVQGFGINPNESSSKSPFVNASVMKNITVRLSNGDIVNLKRGDKISVANNYGDSPITYLEGSSSQQLKWDVEVYYPRTSSGLKNTSSGIGGAPQFDGGKKKRHNFPYFY